MLKKIVSNNLSANVDQNQRVAEMQNKLLLSIDVAQTKSTAETLHQIV